MSDEHERPDHGDEVPPVADVDVSDSDTNGDELEGDELEFDVVEVEVVTVEVLEVDAETAYAARDAALEAAGSQDDALDEALEDVDAGDREVREPTDEQARAAHVPTGPGELPLLIAARERFASLDDVAVTGDARVDAATARLDELPDLPSTDHVAVYDDVHQRLQDALADADPR